MGRSHGKRGAFGVAIIAGAVFAAGCGGGGSHPGLSSLLPSGATTPAPANVAPAAASVNLKITIPKGAAASAYRRRPSYISPATNSLTIAQNGGTPAVFALNATAPGCTSTSSGLSCNVAFPATSGQNQVFSVAVYASTNGTGTPLSIQNVVATIVAHQNNQIAFTLDGVVATISIALSQWVLAAGQPGTTNVVVNALDPSGNTIVGPGVYADAGGNPLAIVLTDSDASGATKLAQTTVTQATTIPLSYNGAGGVTSVTIGASAPNLATKSIQLSIATPSVPLGDDQVEAALADVVATYRSMPHGNLANDLDTLAAQMVQSGAFRYAAQTPGGISAILSDGTPVLVFADHPEVIGKLPATHLRGGLLSVRRSPQGLVFPSGSPSGSPSPSPSPSPTPTPLGPGPGPETGHEIAFLINSTDMSGAFTPSRQRAFGNAFAAAGFTAATGYNVDVMPITIDNIVALGQTHPIDFLNVATHGIVFSYKPSPNVTLPPSLPPANYANLSDTRFSTSLRTAYQADFDAGRLVLAVDLFFNGGSGNLPYVAFTPDFVTEHVTFNPGAVVVNSSCFGESPLIASAVTTSYKSAGVGRYLGWTKEVDGTDADETDAFLYDRLLGEQSPSVTGLEAFVTPRMPPQRPFPLDAIQKVESTEMRGGPITRAVEPYTSSDSGNSVNSLAPPLGDGTLARLVVSDFGGETVANAPFFYGLPQIAKMSVNESNANGTLTIAGAFPMNPGTVTVTDSSGKATFTPVTWSPTTVTVTLPASGAHSAGLVQVFTAEGIGSNVVPLTQWSGTLAYQENESIPMFAGKAGSGSGTIAINYAITFRADVHPMVPMIDTTPAPQNFAFENTEGNSTGTVGAFAANFASADGKVVSNYAIAQNVPALTPTFPPLQPGTFEIRSFPEGSQPSPCNNGMPGPEGDQGNVACPIEGWILPETSVTCSDSGANAGCPDISVYDILGSYGAGFDAGGLLTMTMNPNTYAVTVSGTKTSYGSIHFGAGDSGTLNPATASMSGTIGAPLYAPVAMTGTSSIRRAPSTTSPVAHPRPGGS